MLACEYECLSQPSIITFWSVGQHVILPQFWAEEPHGISGTQNHAYLFVWTAKVDHTG